MENPKIRFKGFTKDWEQRKLDDMCEIITKQTGFDYSATIKPSLVTESSNDTYSFIQNKDFSGNEINLDTDFYIPIEVAERFPKILLDKPSLLISISGRIGNVGFYDLPHKSFIGGAVGICKLRNSQYGEFIVQELESDYGQNYFHSLIKASSHANITVEDIRNINILMPKDDCEQEKIASYFSHLDHLITLHQRKCEQTKKLKKYMLQKMFPQNGAKVPEIRFDGFTYDWEQRKLKEIADKVSEKNKNNEFSEPFTNSAEQGIISQKDYFDREIVNNENLDSYYIVRNDDFIYNPRISVTAPVGPINRNRLGRNGVMSPLYTVFRTHDIDNLYLEFYFKTTKWHRFMKLNGDSGARFDRFTISSTQFMEMPIPYPMLDEQRKMGEYFDSLDHLITLHQRKCDELKKMKKYMLQNMFI
ncbi:restriction endonuclease subunit S [Agathobacter rectalis]|uniref:restriction endonuclease subunit S n=1 Tax=Agathobacter rectalis TaxID=39491 RepID=UPI003ED8BA86